MLSFGLISRGGRSGGHFVPGSVPKVKYSSIPQSGDGIMVTFDRPMHMTASLQDAITVIINGAAPVKADHVQLSANHKQLGFMFPANHFKNGDVVTWAYNDQHATEELKGAETGGVEVDNQTYAVTNNVSSTTLPDHIVNGSNDIYNSNKLVINTHTVPPPPPNDDILDLDGDGLADEVVADFGNVLITQDDDSINIDIDGDGIADITIPKP